MMNAINRLPLFYLVASVQTLAPAICHAQALPAYSITNVAGTGVAGISGDGGRATEAQINIPMGVAIDRSGNLFVADQLNGRIRKITPDGVISTVAGTGTGGYAGDGGTATSAQLYNPCGVAVDAAGNLFIADSSNHRIRKVTVGGVISTVAGTGEVGYSGDGGAATSATFNTPLNLAVDAAGNLYIADTLNNAIRKLATDGTISTVAGTGGAGYSGNGGPATSAGINHPNGIAVDASGTLYFADTFNHCVRRVTSDGTITTVAGDAIRRFTGDGGPAASASLDYPEGVALDNSGLLYISDSLNSRIRVVTPSGMIATIAGNGDYGNSGDGGPAARAKLSFPQGLAVDDTGQIYVSDNQNSRIRLLRVGSGPVDVGPSITISGVSSATAFGGFSAVAPGSWIEIYGANLASSSRAWSAADFNGNKAPTSLDGTRVLIAGQPAFVAYVSPNQVNAQVPLTVSAGTQQITVITAAGTSSARTVSINAIQPGLLAPSAFVVGGKQYVAAVLDGGSAYVAPAGGIPGAASRPARPGETITLYGTGFGEVTPHIDAGELVQQSNTLSLHLEIFFGPVAGRVTYAGLAPGAIGLYQFNVVVPNVAASDAVPITFALGRTTGEQTLYTVVGN
jgi:uncharacterized protein (TIGR03437 family)